MDPRPHYLRFARALAFASAGVLGACAASNAPGNDGAMGEDVAAPDAPTGPCMCPSANRDPDASALPYCVNGTAAWTADHCGDLTGPLAPPEVV